MTAEIAVMNKWGIALAADSKVTISGGSSDKGYDSVNKLFALSKFHPVGIMVYGNAEFMEIPWETIIKSYRESVGQKSFPTVDEWKESFLSYLLTLNKIDQGHISANLGRIVTVEVINTLQECRSKAMSKHIPLASEEFINLLKSEIDWKIELLDESEDWKTKSYITKMFKKYGESIKSSLDEIIGPYDDDELSKKFLELLRKFFLKKSLSERLSGIVVAGYGADEFFPSLSQYETDGYIGDEVKILHQTDCDVRRSMNASIMAFAQQDMVQRFMNGIQFSLFQSMIEAFYLTIRAQSLKVLEKFAAKKHQTDEVRSFVEDLSFEAVECLEKDIGDHIQHNFVDPVLSMVAMLPKEELANLAESLVELTSLKRRVSSEAETVGGPIDVALISKGDGFIWIKRKHYFRPELNHSYFKNYFLGMRGRDGEDGVVQDS